MNWVGIRHFFVSVLALLVPVTIAQAQADPPPLAAYGELPAIEDVVISPSGERFAMLATANGKRYLTIFNGDLKPLRSMPMDGLKVRSFDFVTDDLLLFRRSTTGNLGFGFAQNKFEFHQAYTIPVSDGEIGAIFHERRNIVDAVFGYHGTRMVDGRPTAFFGAIELARGAGSHRSFEFKHGRPALYAVDLIDNESKRIDYPAPENETSDWLVGAGGEVLARLDQSEISGDWKISSGGSVIAKGKNPAGGVFLIAIGREGTTIIFGARDTDGETTRWFEVATDGGTAPVEVYADEDIERIYTDRMTGQLIGYLRENGGLEPVFFDPDKTSKAKKIRKAFAQFNNRMIDWTGDFGHVVVHTDGNGDSGSYFKVDLAQLRADPIGWERPLIPPEAVGAVETVEYKAQDGLEMDGILTLPPGRDRANLPVILLPHGGPHSHDTASFDWWAQAFASRGYAVFQPNFRGSTNRTEAFTRAGDGEWGKKMQSDISDGLAALAEKGIVDPDRACIVGASYGGYAALVGVTLQQGLYRCAVSVNGIGDVSMMSRIERRESGRSKVAARSLEMQLGPRSGYKAISPRYYAERADAPILLIHGRDDTVVAFAQSVKMADALRDAGKEYQFVELEGEDHWLSLGATRQAMLKASLSFVQLHNPAD